MQESDNSNQPLFYRKTGSGPVMVLIHGFPESGTIWRKIEDQLALDFTLIIPDLPGSGNSPLQQVTDLGQMADLIRDILVTESINSAVIAGHSMGGYIGFEFAARYPNMVAGLSLVHSIPNADDPERIKIRQKAIELIRNGGKNAFLRQMVPNLFSPDFKQSAPEVVEEQISNALLIAEEGLVNFYQAMIKRNDHSQTIFAATYPIQWIIGLEDNVIFYKKILEQCYKSPINFVTFYNNCGHMSMFETPDRLINDLKYFASYCYK